jgi:hypothetical protein
MDVFAKGSETGEWLAALDNFRNCGSLVNAELGAGRTSPRLAPLNFLSSNVPFNITAQRAGRLGVTTWRLCSPA